MDKFFLNSDYQSRMEPEYCVRSDNSLQWQLPAYKFAKSIAVEQNIDNVVDVGCGHAEKLIAFFHDRKITGIDVGENIKHCAAMYPQHNWLEHDVSEGIDVKLAETSLVLCIDVIEHLVNPFPLLNWLVGLQDDHVIVLTTPERDITHGLDHMGPPPNSSHVREWNLFEFSSLCRHVGLRARFALLQARSVDALVSDLVAVIP